ncbi:hypothetical protein [Aeromicrobium sp. Leaf350]|uniref:hypothetical protein n=1 Tax=Aeromicrobium sp. Leaf350 TaxID=2876565 RepID=UPI001E5C35B4|nr:hypothetical protein [Aeromicrobium sp. Leaf350]
MNDTVNEGRRRAGVPVDSGVAREGRHRRVDSPPPPPEGPQDEQGNSDKRRWFRRG